MSLFSGPEQHAENPPDTWKVVKLGERNWVLTLKTGDQLSSHYTTKRAATEATQWGFLIDLYNDEGRWYAGEQVRNWRPYAEVVAENQRRLAWKAAE